MSSYKTHDFINTGCGNFGKNRPAKNANDLTIHFKKKVEVLGVNGISPSDPNAPYTLEGDGTGTIKIKDMAKVGPNGSVKVRVKNEEDKVAELDKNPNNTFWTFDGMKISKEGMLLTMVDSVEDEESETGEETAAVL